MFMHQLDPSTKVITLKNHPRSFGVTGVKRSFPPKMLLLIQITWHGYVTHAYASVRYLLQKVSVEKFTRGHLGSLGSKGQLRLKCYNLSMLHGMTVRLIHVYQLETL